jgi:hypothetical protein
MHSVQLMGTPNLSTNNAEALQCIGPTLTQQESDPAPQTAQHHNQTIHTRGQQTNKHSLGLAMI